MKDNTNILINILTRTSNRPVGFVKCYTSIKKQTYKNIRHIVAYDNKSDLHYLEGLEVDKIYVGDKYNNEDFKQVDNEGNTQAIYNLYCNDLLDEVKEGWILFLDDDNNLFHNKVIEEVVGLIKKANNKETLFIWQLRYPNGVLLPNNVLIEKELIKKYNIDSSCFLFHSKFKNVMRWDEFKVSDFRFLDTLARRITNKVFSNKAYIQVGNFGGLGTRNDIETNNELGYMFYKNIFWHFIPKKHFELFGIPIFQKKTYVGFQKKALKIPKKILNLILSKK